MITLTDVQQAFADLPANLQEYALYEIPSVPEQYLYYVNHWHFGQDSEEVNRQRAINDVYSWFVSLKNGTYGLQY